MKKVTVPEFLLKRKNTIIDIISALFVLLFVYSSLSKLSEHDKFKWVLGESILLSDHAGLIAWGMPAIELIVALLLFLPRSRTWGLYSSFVLMTIFTIYLGYMIAFDSKLPCSCGGVLQEMTWNQHLVFNIFFTLLAALAIWLTKKNTMKKNTDAEVAPIVFT